MPSLDGATEWISGSAAEALKETEGHPVLVHFWSLSCGMCKENLPRVAEWREKYALAGLRLIAIHMPRYPADTDVAAVREAVTQYQIIDPVAVDNEHKLRDAFQNEHGYVPAYYLFDEQHKLKSFAAGEYGTKVMEPALERLLGVRQVAGV
jgi:thiol-disulfide isomerase/thioredoxin